MPETALIKKRNSNAREGFTQPVHERIQIING